MKNFNALFMIYLSSGWIRLGNRRFSIHPDIPENQKRCRKNDQPYLRVVNQPCQR